MQKQITIRRGDSSSELCQAVREMLNQYPNGLTVTIEPWCAPRTVKQNGQYQVLVKRLAEQSGYSPELIKQYAKERAVGKGYPVRRDENGEPVLQNGMIVPVSSKDATIGQFKILIETLYEIGLENGFILEDVKG